MGSGNLMRWRGYLSRLLGVSTKNGSILVCLLHEQRNELPMRDLEKQVETQLARKPQLT